MPSSLCLWAWGSACFLPIETFWRGGGVCGCNEREFRGLLPAFRRASEILTASQTLRWNSAFSARWDHHKRQPAISHRVSRTPRQNIASTERQHREDCEKTSRWSHPMKLKSDFLIEEIAKFPGEVWSKGASRLADCDVREAYEKIPRFLTDCLKRNRFFFYWCTHLLL